MSRTKKKVGRPTTSEKESEILNEKATQPLMMSKTDSQVTIDDLTSKFKRVYGLAVSQASRGVSIGNAMKDWNRANPFLQNQRVKSTIADSKSYTKKELGEFAADPGNHEMQLQGASLSSSFSQQIYYNMLRRSADIPLYLWYIVPPYLEDDEYKSKKFLKEYSLANQWFKKFDPPATLKTIALQVKREGKASYILRSSITNGNVDYATLEKLPTDFVKITGIGQLGYTVSFDFAYFLQLGYEPDYFGPFFVACWNDIVTKGVVYRNKANDWRINAKQAMNYSFTWKGRTYSSILESQATTGTADRSFLFWVQLPFDFAFCFGSDNSHPFSAPDTTGILQKLQELTDYSTLAGLIASTPLTAVLTGEAEAVNDPRPGKCETVLDPETLLGLQDMFNSMTSTNVEAYFLPLKNIKLQQLSSDVNSSDIVSNATENLVEVSGEGGLTITDTKPNVSQIKTAQLLAAAAQDYVTLQFQRALNYVLQNSFGFSYRFEFKVWGDIFTIESEKKFLKEAVVSGNVSLLPKLMSSEGLTMENTAALTKYVASLDIYKYFQTLTMQKQAELNGETSDESDGSEEEEEPGTVGRPRLDDSDIDNEATAASRDAGTNTSDNRDSL